MRARHLLVLAVLLVPSTASAKTVHFKNFVSPSKLISCISVKYGGRGVECSAPYLPRRDLDPYYALEPHGKATAGERGDYPGYPNAKQHTLQYGDTYKRHGIRCTMRESGLTCRNRDAHGFHLAKGALRRF